MTEKHNSSCLDDFDPSSLPADIALEKIYATTAAITGTETVSIREALNRVIAQDIKANFDIPYSANSAMDGYAINHADIPENGNTVLVIVGTALAGKPYLDKIKFGECVQIMTGALLPDGANTVVIQEQVEAKQSTIRIDSNVKANANIRQAGEDIATGQLVLARGKYLKPADIGLLASLGIGTINVFRRLCVAFFSTGDELRQVGEKLGKGDIYDSNRYTLHGMLSQIGVEIIDMGIVRDNRQALLTAFQEATEMADMLITTGGASVGAADHIKEILQQTGSIEFSKVAIKPGRPLIYGHIQNTHFFGLPGNPVSVMVTFQQFVKPALLCLMGTTPPIALSIPMPCLSKLRKRPGRIEYQRGIMVQSDKGKIAVKKTGHQGSGILSSMAKADCFIILPTEAETIYPGTIVQVQPLINFL